MDFERFVYRNLSEMAEPLFPMKTREERTYEYETGNFTPDLMFMIDGLAFYVDCHYRSYYDANNMELDNWLIYRRKMRVYRNINIPIFEFCGAGGEAYDPEYMMFKDLDNIHGNRLPAGSYSLCDDLYSRVMSQLLFRLRGRYAYLTYRDTFYIDGGAPSGCI